MSTPNRFGSAVSAIVLSSMIAGCATSQQHANVSNAGAPKAGYATRALLALNAHDVTNAILFAEAAVERTPGDSALRTLLGNAYFAAGRFASAEGAYQDSLSINSNQPKVVLKLALVKTALGKKADAVAFLQAAQSFLDASDYGLALALAGETDQAVAVLDAAARQPSADATVRQNLALAYALGGSWTEAKTIAAQDLPADQLAARMNDWMLLASPKKPADQVAAVVGVTPAASDAGQPVRLALIKSDTRLAAATPPPEPVPVPAPVQVAQAAPVSPAAPPAIDNLAPQPQFATGLAAAPAPEPELAVAPAPPPPRSYYAEAVEVASATTAMLSAAAHKAEAAVTAFLPKKTVAKKASPKVPSARRLAAAHRPLRSGDAVMQLGSYRSPKQVMEGWARLSANYPALRAYLPLRARFDSPNGTFWRLSIQGFRNRGEAVTRCEALRSRGGKCFVRAFAGDAPVQLASN